MKRFFTLSNLMPGLMLWMLCSLSVMAQDYEEDELPYVEIIELTDFNTLTKKAQQTGKVIMLEMSATYCGYCKTLEEEIIKPMLRSGDYNDNVLIRQVNIDIHGLMDDLGGDKTSPDQLARRYDIFITPTLLFLDGQGEEVSERILGVNSLDYYGAYVDEALEQGYHKIQSR